MHQQAQLRLKKDEVEKLGAAAYVVLAMDRFRAKVFKEENLLLSTFEGPFSKEKSLVFATALSDPAGSASALYGVSRKCVRWGSWVENHPNWFVIDRRGILTYAAQPTFATPASYVDDIDRVLGGIEKCGALNHPGDCGLELFRDTLSATKYKFRYMAVVVKAGWSGQTTVKTLSSLQHSSRPALMRQVH